MPWNVVLADLDKVFSEQKELSFIDAKEIFGEDIFILMDIYNKIIENVKHRENYVLLDSILSIKSSSGEEVGVDDYIVILSVDQAGFRFGFLIKILDIAIQLIGVWPDYIVEAVKEEENILWGVLAVLAEEPDNWKTVHFITPKK